MTAAIVTLTGQYFDGHQPLAVAASLLVSGPEAVLIGTAVERRYTTQQLRVSPRIGHADRFVTLPDGGQLQCPDQEALDRLPHDVQSEGLVAWLEARTTVALVAIGAIVALLLGGYFYGLPAAAERVAMHVPIATEQALGAQVLEWLDANQWFRPTRLDEEQRASIRADFDELRAGLPLAAHYRLEFRDSFIGPNAFALPGGTIAITDAMVQAAESYAEVAAVLAHEIGHVERRHALRHLLQNSAVAVVAATLTADAASLSVAVAGVPALLAQARYSRAFETEADDFAFALLRARGRSPEDFASLMERLAAQHEDRERALGFVATHPVTAERVQRARAAGRP
jgi:Zn-dependent protease with chaperone function